MCDNKPMAPYAKLPELEEYKEHKEYKEYKEQEWKNIEVAVELDCPELYERYLSMKFRDFMDWYWNVNGAKELGKRMPVPERIYVGNAFCHLLFPEKRQLFEIFKKAESEGLAVTVTFSYLREFMLKPVEKLLDELEEWCRNRETFLEIAANDWGLLELLRERKEWKEEKEVLVPCMGTLLNKRKKDPRMGYKQGETGYFRENSLNAKFYRTYLRDTFGIRRYEWESCGYRQQFPEGTASTFRFIRRIPPSIVHCMLRVKMENVESRNCRNRVRDIAGRKSFCIQSI